MKHFNRHLLWLAVLFLLLSSAAYAVTAVATDNHGLSTTTDPVTVIFDRNRKIGHFSISFSEVAVPLAGIPVEIIRTYDSRDKRAGDFGTGFTDITSAVTDAYDYDAFGTLIAQSGDTPNFYLYAGEQFDSDLALSYIRARYLNTDTGRFWTMDPFEGFLHDPVSLHRYLCAHGNPVNGWDPTGLATSGGQVLATGVQGTMVRTLVRRSIRRINASLCAMAAKLAAPFAQLAPIPGFQRHQVLQNTAVTRVPGYSRGLAVGVYCLEDLHRLAQHMILPTVANQIQHGDLRLVKPDVSAMKRSERRDVDDLMQQRL